MDLEILYQNDWFAVINKPANTSFHDEKSELSENGSQGFFNFVQQKLNCKLWPVHRLDKLTSGLLLLAKSKAVAAEFGHLFESKSVSKYYLALSDNKPKKKQGKIIGDIVKSRGGSFKLSTANTNPSKTRFKSYAIASGLRLFVLTPLTGKTHQLRVVMRSLGSPILGDIRYKGNESDRAYLHAYQIEFMLRGETFKFNALPSQGEHFQNLALQQPKLASLISELASLK